MKIGQAVLSLLHILVGAITFLISAVLIGALFNGLEEYFGPEIPAVDPEVYDLPSEEDFLQFLKDVESDSTLDKEAGLPVYPPMDSTEIAAELEIYRYYNSWRSIRDYFLKMFWLIVAIVVVAPQAVWIFRRYEPGKRFRTLHPWWFYPTAIICLIIANYLDIRDREVISLAFLGITVWIIQRVMADYVDRHQRTVDKEDKALQRTAEDNPLPPTDPKGEIPDAVRELWKQAVWLAKNFRELWPGAGFKKKETAKYMAALVAYDGFIERQSIALPKIILDHVRAIISAIHEYKSGKDLRWIPPYDPESSREGGKQMSSGAKNFNKAFGELRQAIRDEYGVE